MEIMVSDRIIETVCNSLRTSRQSLKKQLSKAATKTKEQLLEHLLAEVEEALLVFEQVN